MKSEIGGEGVYALWPGNLLEAWLWKNTHSVVSARSMVLGDFGFL